MADDSTLSPEGMVHEELLKERIGRNDDDNTLDYE